MWDKIPVEIGGPLAAKAAAAAQARKCSTWGDFSFSLVRGQLGGVL
nr:hypothetical protein [uncultured Solibaculum sp.]